MPIKGHNKFKDELSDSVRLIQLLRKPRFPQHLFKTFHFICMHASSMSVYKSVHKTIYVG